MKNQNTISIDIGWLDKGMYIVQRLADDKGDRVRLIKMNLCRTVEGLVKGCSAMTAFLFLLSNR